MPTAKLIDGESFSIVSDYIGRPIQVYDQNGGKVWSAEYDIYGNVSDVLLNFLTSINQDFMFFGKLFLGV